MFIVTENKIHHDVFGSASIKEYVSYGNTSANKANNKREKMSTYFTVDNTTELHMYLRDHT